MGEKMDRIKKCVISFRILFLKTFVKLLTAIFVILSLRTPCYAQAPQNFQNGLTEFVESSLEQLWQDELMKIAPQNVRSVLKEEDINSLPQLLSMTPKELFHIFKETVVKKFREPFSLVGRLLGTVLLCAVVNTVQKSGISQKLKEIFAITAAVTVVSLLSAPVLGCIQQTVQVLKESAVFTMSFAPVMSGVMIAGGNPASAGVYNMLLFVCSEVLSELAAQTLIPLLNIYLALCITAPLAPFLQLGKITTVIKKVVCWGLGILTTIFVGVLSLQTIIGSSGDSLMMKTSKFVIGSMIPIIGGTISEALGAAKSCVHLLKGVVGSFGIFAAVLTFLPIISEVSLWYCAVNIAAWIGSMLDAGQVSAILSSVAQTFSVLLAMVCSFMLMFLVSTTLMLMMTVR